MTSECLECPPSVIRCAHWNGMMVGLLDFDLIQAGCCEIQQGSARFVVATAHKAQFDRRCDDCGALWYFGPLPEPRFYTPDEPSALTEFQTRAAHLLERA